MKPILITVPRPVPNAAVRRFVLVTLLVMVAPATRAAVTVYTDETTFKAVLAAGYYEENFAGPISGTSKNYSGPPPALIYAYTAAVPSGRGSLWRIAENSYGTGLSTQNRLVPLSLTVTSANVSALGGVFFLNDFNQIPMSGDFTLKVTDTDGTTDFVISSTASLPLPFRGFVSDKLITKVELTAGTPVDAYYAVTHLSVGVAKPQTTVGGWNNYWRILRQP